MKKKDGFGINKEVNFPEKSVDELNLILNDLIKDINDYEIISDTKLDLDILPEKFLPKFPIFTMDVKENENIYRKKMNIVYNNQVEREQIEKDYIVLYKRTQLLSQKKNFLKSKRKLLDKNFIDYENDLFGVSLDCVFNHFKQNDEYVFPPFLNSLFDYVYENCLDIEGIFRLSGDTTQVDQLKSLINESIFFFKIS
jgi:hypothetical protein